MFGSEAACTQPGASCDAQQHYQYQRELGSCFNQTPSVAVWEAPLEVARAPPLLSIVLVVVRCRSWQQWKSRLLMQRNFSQHRRRAAH